MRYQPGQTAPNKGKGKGIALLRAHVGHTGDVCLIWPMARDDKGYGLVGYLGTVYKASRLMCILAHGEPPSPMHEAAHSCGNGALGCYHPQHLSWKTGSENQYDSIAHGTFGRKRGAARFKLTETQVAQIKAMQGKKTQRELGPMYGVSPETIGKIFRGQTWTTGARRVGGFTPEASRKARATQLARRNLVSQMQENKP
jgi:hypothetical protein